MKTYLLRRVCWAAGFVEGEGYFTSKGTTPEITVAQIVRDPLDILQQTFGGSIVLSNRQTKKGNPIFTWRIGGTPAASMLMTIYPLLTKHKRRKIPEILRRWKNAPGQRALRVFSCPKGHAYAGYNLLTQKNGKGHVCRRCRICTVARTRNWRHRKGETNADQKLFA